MIKKPIHGYTRFFAPVQSDRAGVWGLSVTLIFLLFYIAAALEPFGIDHLSMPYLKLRLFCLSLFTGIIVYIFQYYLPRYFTNFYDIHRWKPYKSVGHLIVLLLCVSLKNVLLINLLFPPNTLVSSFGQTLMRSAGMGLIYGIFILGWNYLFFLEQITKKKDSQTETKNRTKMHSTGVAIEPVTSVRVLYLNKSLYVPQIAILIGVLVYFIIVVFRPFEIRFLVIDHVNLRFVGIGVIASVVVYIFNGVLPKIFARIYKRHGQKLWGIAVHSCLGLLCAGLLCGMYLDVILEDDPSKPGVLKIISYTFLIGIIPSLILAFWHYIAYLKVSQFDRLLPISPEDNPITQSDSTKLLQDNYLTFHGLRTQRVLLCSAMGNYIQVYYSTESGVSKKIVRSTLKDVMNTLEGGTFLKCHRSFVVNMSFVKGYSGNTKGMKLEVEGIKDPIQVSRQYMQPIREWIETKDDH